MICYYVITIEFETLLSLYYFINQYVQRIFKMYFVKAIKR